MLFIHF